MHATTNSASAHERATRARHARRSQLGLLACASVRCPRVTFSADPMYRGFSIAEGRVALPL
jgi:hypothetical protein